MKILHLYKAYYPIVGGIENHIKLLAESQVALGHEVTVLVASESMNTVRNVMNGVQVIKVGRFVSLASTPSLRLSPSYARCNQTLPICTFPILSVR